MNRIKNNQDYSEETISVLRKIKQGDLKTLVKLFLGAKKAGRMIFFIG